MSTDQIEYPKLRRLDAFPIKEGDRELICLRDPERITDAMITLPRPAFFVVSHFDGTRSLVDIQASYMRQFGEILFSEDLRNLIRQLDENLMLDSDAFQRHLSGLREDFAASATREPVCAGSTYENDRPKLLDYLDSLFTGPDGPGLPGEPIAEDLVGLVAPHIDPERGGATYAHGYRELAERCGADTFVLLGTNHQPSETLFTVTSKKFRTPLGDAEPDEDLIRALEDGVSQDLRADEFCHRAEHSLEFQVLFLQYVLGRMDRDFRIVPVLCSSPYMAQQGALVPREPEAAEFSVALARAADASGKKTAFVAGADLAHIGPQFGDPQQLTTPALRASEQADKELLGSAENMNEEEFLSVILRERDARRICGAGPIYTMLKAMRVDSGKLLHYGQWADPSGNGSVSFASMAFYAEEKE